MNDDRKRGASEVVTGNHHDQAQGSGARRMDRCGDSLPITAHGRWLMVCRKDGATELVYQQGESATDRHATNHERLIAELCEVIAELRKDRA